MGKLADTFGQIVKTMKEGDEIFQLNIKEVEESVEAIVEQERVVYEKVNLKQEFRDFDFESAWKGFKYPKSDELDE